MRPALILACFVASVAEVSAQNAGDVRTQSVPGTEVTFDLAFVPAGSFLIGSSDNEAGRDDDEGPQRTVRLSAFWMSTTEATYDAFAVFRFRRLDDNIAAPGDVLFDADAITRPSPPYEDPAHGMGGNGFPVTGMTRLSALRFARWLSEKTGQLYRLPTEAEWEYACKAGGGVLAGEPWYENNSGGVYHAAGTASADGLGIHELQGNVAEWVMDSYSADAYASLGEGAQDPLNGTPARGRGLVRGGAFDDPLDRLRCAERFPEASAWKARDPQMPKSRWWNTDSPHVGFRLVTPSGEHTMDEIRAYWAEILGA